jgi:signal transduction histidine kinase
LAEEQAALRRLATLVAGGAPPQQVFAAATEEVGRLLMVDYASMSRFESDGVLAYVAAWSGSGKPLPPVGTRVSIGGNNVNSLVFETGRPARIDRYADASGPLTVAIRDEGVRSAVGAPIIVEGRVWGAIGVGSVLKLPLPSNTEARLISFTELLAAAIANAESRAGLARLAEEQAALRRIATLVARDVPPEEVFAAVTEEVARLLVVQTTRMGRYESDGTVTFVAASGMTDAFFPAGSRLILGGRNVSTLVAQTGRSARIDDYADASGPIGDTIRENGLGSAAGTPITVDGRLWGVMAVASTLNHRLPLDTEARLAQFTELLAMAIANAESRAGLVRLGEEQAALRRVATLVAQGVPPDELFAAVAEEIVNVLPVQGARIGRYESDGTVTFVATIAEPGATGALSASRLMLVEKNLPLGGNNLATVVFETGRPARLKHNDASGPIVAGIREIGGGSGVGTPIVVDGRLWGLATAGSTVERLLPPDIESRLTDFTELLATAIANAESRAEVAASRTRIVAAADETRRRIERDLHDGAQQRLVHTVIVQQLALRALERGDENVGELMVEALKHAEDANSELSELAHGILPSVLTREGLRAGVQALVSRMSLPVSVDMPAERLPAGIEATAYFVVSEALTNVVKHAHADRAAVMARVERGVLRVEICDEGVGGAHVWDGTGLRGLADRVSALDGRLVVESSPGQGTRVCALLPVTDPDQALGESRR